MDWDFLKYAATPVGIAIYGALFAYGAARKRAAAERAAREDKAKQIVLSYVERGLRSGELRGERLVDGEVILDGRDSSVDDSAHGAAKLTKKV